jgi:hypothetical protein
MTVHISRFLAWAFAAGILAAVATGGWSAQAEAQSDTAAESDAEEFENELCLGCHGEPGFAMPDAGGEMRQLHISPEKFAMSVHSQRNCVECHKDIIEFPHRENVERKVGCVQCHRSLWDAAQREDKTQEFARLGEVVQQIESYWGSIHAQPNIDDQSRTNATCYDCHDAHYINPIDSEIGAVSRLDIPEVCGRCHTEEKAAYLTSVHGKENSLNANPFAAVCIDCHTTPRNSKGGGPGIADAQDKPPKHLREMP